MSRSAHWKPYSCYVKNVPDYEVLLQGLRNAGFQIRSENWQLQKTGVIATLPDRDWGYAFRDTLHGLNIQGSVLWAEKSHKQYDGTDSGLSGPIPSPEAARRVIIDAFAPAQTPASPAQVSGEISSDPNDTSI
ncbi:hypothetical protein G7Y79_00011g031430 [Physcia stellaris]|nr:hypothetical protein G7Y79_00011g031430 [Physcia stellaris]